MHPAWHADSRLRAALLLAVVLAVWPAALTGPFQFDDWNVIVYQPAVHSVAAWWDSMPGIRPLLKLSYALDWQHGGGNALSFHLSNLLIHAANVLLVWQLLRRWPGLGVERETAAWWGAIIFALHPVQAEAVAYIAGRSVSLMAFFWLAATLCWLEGEAAAKTAPRKSVPVWKIAALILFGAALAVRETALTLPWVLWVWQRAAGMSWRGGFIRLWPFWAAFLVALLALLALPAYRNLLGFSLNLRLPLDNLAAQVDALAYLLSRPLFLLETNIDPDPAQWPPGSAEWLLAAGILVLCLIVSALALARAPLWGLALLWPFLILWPTNSLVARLDLVADRHLYLALLGPAMALVSAVMAGACIARKPACQRVGVMLALLGLGITLAMHTRIRLAEFSSETALWSATAVNSPNKARVWNNLGYGYLEEGNPVAAVSAFREALRLNPDHPLARQNLQRALIEELAAK